MDKSIRNAIERATQQARKLLDEDFSSQLEGTFDVLRNGVIAATGGTHLSALQQSQRRKIVAAIEHKRESGMNAVDAVADYVRDAAFTTLMERADVELGLFDRAPGFRSEVGGRCSRSMVIRFPVCLDVPQ